jgi:hypothetical protein
MLSFVIILQSCYKNHSIPETQHIASHAIFCNHLAKLLQKIIASQKNQHIASHAIFCNHLAKLLQKIIASQKPNTSHRMLSFVIILERLCSPNEYFGWPNERYRMMLLSFVISLRQLISVLELTPLKSTSKCVPKRSFGHPKSSFGEHKLVKM